MICCFICAFAFSANAQFVYQDGYLTFNRARYPDYTTSWAGWAHFWESSNTNGIDINATAAWQNGADVITNSWVDQMGYGLVDAYAALKAGGGDNVYFTDQNVSTDMIVQGCIGETQNVNSGSKFEIRNQLYTFAIGRNCLKRRGQSFSVLTAFG